MANDSLAVVKPRKHFFICVLFDGHCKVPGPSLSVHARASANVLMYRRWPAPEVFMTTQDKMLQIGRCPIDS